MDVSLLPAPVSKYSRQRTGALLTVRSANTPYSLNRRSGVRRHRGFSDEERESASEVKGEEKCSTQTNGSAEEEDQKAAGYQARIGSSSTVVGQSEDKITSGCEINQRDTEGKTISELTDRGGSLAPERRGRTDLRRFNLPSRSRSLDWKAGERSPGRSKIWSSKQTGEIIKPSGSLDEKAGIQGATARVRSSIQTYYNSTSTSYGQETIPVSQTLDRTSRGYSLPTRLRSPSGPCTNDRTSASFGAKGGQSILERIEKLYGSAGFGITEESNSLASHHKETIKDFPQSRLSDWSSGGTFPRRFSSGQANNFRNSFTTTQTDNSGFESRTRERSSGGLWQGQNQGVNLGGGLRDTGTMSLDRARSRNTVAARIRAARAAGEIAVSPQSSPSSDEWRSASLRDWSGQRGRRLSGSADWGSTSLTHGTQRERTGWLDKKQETEDKVKEKPSANEDVFESSPPKITLMSTERRKFPEGLSVNSSASVRNKINQFEALTQRSQGLATGQVQMPRRAFSVPAQFSRAHDGVKKSGSAKVIGGLRDKWEGLKEGGEKDEERGKKLGLERSFSVDEVGLRLAKKESEGKDLVQSEIHETKRDGNPPEDLKHPKLKSNLELLANEEHQTQHENFYIDDPDLAKLSDLEETSDRPTSLSLLISGNAPDELQKKSVVTSPVSDEDKTPTNTPNQSPFLSPTTLPANLTPATDNKSSSALTQEVETPKADASPPLHCFLTSSPSSHPDLASPCVNEVFLKGKKQVLDLDAWVAGLSPTIKVWDDDEYEDDDESTQKDEDSNYDSDSDSGESSVTITSNMSQSDHRSFCVSLSDLCNFAGVDYDSENESDEWRSVGRRSASLSSEMSAFSYVSVLPTEELDKLLEDVRSLGDNTLQDYNDVQVVVLHKEVGVGLGFSLAGGIDQNKPVTVHKVFHLGVAAQEGSIQAGDQVLSINGTALDGFAHWEALRVLRRAKTKELGVVVLRRGGTSSITKGGVKTESKAPTSTQATETGELMCVRLEKNSRDLGFSLEGGVGSSQEDRPLTVQKIFQGGPVDKVCPGDEVVEIEGVSVAGMRRLEVWTLIRRLPPGSVDVVLRRPLKHSET